MQIVAAVRLASRLAREHACTPQLNPDASAEKSLKPLSGLIPVPSGLSPSLLTLSDSVSLCICIVLTSRHESLTREDVSVQAGRQQGINYPRTNSYNANTHVCRCTGVG